LQNGRHFFSASLYSRTRITSKTVHHIMEDNFALRYVLKHPGVNSRAELVPSHGASRRRLGDNVDTFVSIRDQKSRRGRRHRPNSENIVFPISFHSEMILIFTYQTSMVYALIIQLIICKVESYTTIIKQMLDA
jgi:hypothetical protein